MSKVQINYKSGNSITFKVDHLEVVSSGHEVTKLKWDGMSAKPLFAGLSEIESVWELP